MKPARACRWRALLAVLVVALLGACGAQPAAAQSRRDVVVLLGANAFAASHRVARLLDEAAATSDVLGPARFEILAAPRGAPADLPRLLRERLAAGVPVRAVVALLGDLTALPGIDPALAPIDTGALTSRTPRTAEVLAARAELVAQCHAAGATLLLATAPLGREARVLLPELLDVTRELRAAGPVLDLQAEFTRLEDGPLFGNNLDRLDDWGHDALARAVLAALVEALPPRDENERVARLQARGLRAFGAGRGDELRTLLEEVRAAPATSPRAATRRAALLSAAEGLVAHVDDWRAIDAGGAADVPGLATARALLELPPGELAPDDPVELSVVTLLRAANLADAPELALRAAQVWPERLESWAVLQLLGARAQPSRDWRLPALSSLRRFDRGPVSTAAAERLLASWPAPLDALPALICLQRPLREALPDGPVLRLARRHAAVGYVEFAAQTLREADAEQRLPPCWRALPETWASR